MVYSIIELDGQLVGVGVERLAGDVGLEPVVQFLAGEGGGQAAGKIMAQAQDVADFVRHHFADIILRDAQHGLVGQLRRWPALPAGRAPSAARTPAGPSRSPAPRRGTARRAAARLRFSCRPFSARPVLPWRGAAHARARLAAKGEDAGDVGLAVLGLAAQRVEQHVGVGEAGVVPRHPLDDVMLRIGRGDAFRRLFRLHDFFAERPVPIEDAVLDRLDVIRRGVGRIVEHHRLAEIEPRNARRKRGR